MKRKGILMTLILIAVVAIVGGMTVSRMKKNVIAPVVTTVATPTPDTGLDKDVEDIDTKLKALNADAGSIDESLNDQQGNLSEQ